MTSYLLKVNINHIDQFMDDITPPWIQTCGEFDNHYKHLDMDEILYVWMEKHMDFLCHDPAIFPLESIQNEKYENLAVYTLIIHI